MFVLSKKFEYSTSLLSESTTKMLMAETENFEYEEKSEELNNSIHVAGKNIGSSLPINHFTSLIVVYLAWILDL